MYRACVTVVLLASLGGSPVQAANIAGVAIQETAQQGNTQLLLNGAGLRTRLMFKVYVAALYLPQKIATANDIVNSSGPRRLDLYLLRDLDANALGGALKDGLRLNHNESEMAAMKTDIDRLDAILQKFGGAKNGDVISFDFSGGSTEISLNRKPRGNVPGETITRALMRIWLGEKPVDADLKQALLGR